MFLLTVLFWLVLFLVFYSCPGYGDLLFSITNTRVLPESSIVKQKPVMSQGQKSPYTLQHLITGNLFPGNADNSGSPYPMRKIKLVWVEVLNENHG